MTVYITAVHMSPSNANDHQHIANVKWTNDATGNSGQLTRQAMVNWINEGNVCRVRDGQGSVRVGVVNANPPYLRTYADGRPSDNLLSLPRY